MASLIREIQQPPFDKVGVMDLESFFPAKERFALAMNLNNMLASPGFSAGWKVNRLILSLLYTAEGKPRSRHVDRASVVKLSGYRSSRCCWASRGVHAVSAGTSSLRALLYMDEVFGYFPPTANPPAKTPMFTLFKQGRRVRLRRGVGDAEPGRHGLQRASRTPARGFSAGSDRARQELACWRGWRARQPQPGISLIGERSKRSFRDRQPCLFNEQCAQDQPVFFQSRSAF